MRNVRKEIKELVRGLVVNSVESGDNVLSVDERDAVFTMNEEETIFFNNRIKFGNCNIMHVDEFAGDNTVDIDSDIVVGGLIGVKPVFNSDSVFVGVNQILNYQYEPRFGGPIFHYVKRTGDIRDMVHYGL